MKHKARNAGLVRSAVALVSARLREQRVEDFADHALAGARELADAFELLLNLWTWPALGVALGLATDQILDAGAERLPLALEPLQEAAICDALQPDASSDVPALSEADEAAGYALLRDPGLVERIVSDVEAIQ